MPGEDSNYKLSYFETRGLAEPIRLLLHYKGISFQDYKIPSFKKEKDLKTWKAMKPRMPFGQIPMLEFDYCDGDNCEHRELAQSHTICRYLGKKYGLAGKNEWEQAKVDEMADWSKDIWADFMPYFRVAVGIAPGDKAKLHDEIFKPVVLERFVPTLLGKLKESSSGFVCSFGLTWVDFFMAERCTTFDNFEKGEYFKKHGPLEEYTKRVYTANESVKKYVEGRAKCDY